jgi:hypothetical protein
MSRRRLVAKNRILILLAVAVLFCSKSTAAPPTESLLPDTTKGFLSIPDVDLLRENWQKTQLGQLIHDPVMKPFIDDLQGQIENKLSETRLRLGIALSDLEGTYGGEVCLAVMQPEGQEDQHAMTLLVDITDHNAEANALLEKITKNLLDQGAKRRVEKLGNVETTIFTMPKNRPEDPTIEAIYAIHKDFLLVADQSEVCGQILARLNGESVPTLAQVAPFAATMQRCKQEAGDMQPHVRWYVDPFGYAHVVRAAAGGRKRRGVDLLKVLENQGFGVVQGVGGHVFFATGDQEILHRALIYVPAISKSPDGLQLAARMLEFPNSHELKPQDWVSRDTGSYFTFNWKMKEAFEYSRSLVNELLGAKEGDDLFEDIIVSLAEDKDGPQVDLREDLINHFAERATIITDCRRPVTPDSERLMFAVELTNPEAVSRAVNKALESDPDAKKREHDGQVIWEILADEAPVEIEELQIEGDGMFDPWADEEADEEFAEEEERRVLPNSAITVAHGHLLVASHLDYIIDLLKQPVGADLLREASDYQVVADDLQKIGADTCSFRLFSRTDEAYRATYELIRQGKMPESKTLLGKLLNRFLGPEEEGILREQQIDGSKMPEFDAVRRYLGPAGLFVHSEEEGWFIAGSLLSKELK